MQFRVDVEASWRPLPRSGLLIATEHAFAQQPTPEQISAIKQSCRSDFMANCPGCSPAAGRLSSASSEVFPAVGRLQDGGKRGQSAARRGAGRAPSERAAGGSASRPSCSCAASGGAAARAGGRAIARAALHHAAAAHRDSRDLQRRRRALVRQCTAGPRAHPGMLGRAGRQLVARMLPRGRPRQRGVTDRPAAFAG